MTKKPKSYGRQADNKTIKSLSLDASLTAKIEKLAKENEVSFSKYVETYLKTLITEDRSKELSKLEQSEKD